MLSPQQPQESWGPGTTPGWGVCGAHFSELHQRDPSEVLLAAGVLAMYLPGLSGFVSNGISLLGMDKDRRQR